MGDAGCRVHLLHLLEESFAGLLCISHKIHLFNFSKLVAHFINLVFASRGNLILTRLGLVPHKVLLNIIRIWQPYPKL